MSQTKIYCVPQAAGVPYYVSQVVTIDPLLSLLKRNTPHSLSLPQTGVGQEKLLLYHNGVSTLPIFNNSGQKLFEIPTFRMLLYQRIYRYLRSQDLVSGSFTRPVWCLAIHFRNVHLLTMVKRRIRVPFLHFLTYFVFSEFSIKSREKKIHNPTSQLLLMLHFV